MKIPKIPRPLAALVFLLAAVLLSYTIYTFKTAKYETLKPIEAVVVKSEYIDIQRRGRYTAVYCSYTVNGKSYIEQDTLSSSALEEFPEGRTIQAWYDPEHPEQFYCFKPSPGTEAVMPMFLVLPLLIGFMKEPGPNSILK